MTQFTIEPGEKNWNELQEMLGIRARGKIHIVYLVRRKYKKGEKPKDENEIYDEVDE